MVDAEAAAVVVLLVAAPAEAEVFCFFRFFRSRLLSRRFPFFRLLLAVPLSAATFLDAGWSSVVFSVMVVADLVSVSV